MLLTHALALSPPFFCKSSYWYVHSVIVETTKLILVGTRITYYATGDAGGVDSINIPYVSSNSCLR